MKKIIPALLMAASLSLVGCGGATVSDTAPTTTSETTKGKTTQTPTPSAVVSTKATAAAAKTTATATAAAKATTSQPFTASYACVTTNGSPVNKKTIQDVRKEGLKSCRVLLEGYAPSEVETRAVAVINPNSVSLRTDLSKIYKECAAVASGPGSVDPKMMEAVALLCPNSAVAVTVPEAAPGVDSNATKKVAKNGSYFVGSEILPGVWQSDLARVTDCYWEISDAQGNILENNFITLAPQITIVIPADAVGFTATGCGFHWVSE